MRIRYFCTLVLTFCAGIAAMWFVNGPNNASKDIPVEPASATQAPPKNYHVFNSGGSGSSGGAESFATTSSLQITSKPRAQYTDVAREQNVQGTVILQVTFSKDGSIGEITVIQGLGYGPAEQAIAAARQIVFQPKQVNNTPVSVTKTVEYNFNIY
jgi:TonB family protein